MMLRLTTPFATLVLLLTACSGDGTRMRAPSPTTTAAFETGFDDQSLKDAIELLERGGPLLLLPDRTGVPPTVFELGRARLSERTYFVDPTKAEASVGFDLLRPRDNSIVQIEVLSGDSQDSASFVYPSGAEDTYWIEQSVTPSESKSDAISGIASDFERDGYRVFRSTVNDFDVMFWQGNPDMAYPGDAGAVFVTGVSKDGDPVVCTIYAPEGATVIEVKELIENLSFGD